MTRNEARTTDAWRSFDLWATFLVPLLIALPALFLWLKGYGAGAAGCCGAPAAAPPPVVSAQMPAVTPAPSMPTPAPVATTPTPAPAVEPSIDCASIVKGVTVGFSVNRAVLTAAGRRALDQTIACLGSGRYEVAGHTDSDGSEEANQSLSEARARAAIRYLTSRSVPAASLTAAGYGESQPVADNGTPEGKAQNRRITFTPKPE
jgi:OOP family OmpA-OmpF porin